MNEKTENKLSAAKARKAEKNQKVTQFATKLSELRKERGISQKKAAADLGISQALLSHYEKGIRECGLDFVIRCSEYYGITTDYLLGVSESRNGIDTKSLGLTDEELSGGTLVAAIKFLLDIIKTADNEGATSYIYDYYTLCAYRVAITLAKAGVLPMELFKLDFNLGRELAAAAISVEDAKFVFIEDKSRTGTDLNEKNALHAIIARAEELILNYFTSI